MSTQFIEQMRNVDPSTNYKCDLLIDTNVVLEFLSVCDLILAGDEAGTMEAARASPTFRYRQARARYAIILMWWLHQHGRNAGILGNEVTDLLEGKLSPKPEPGGDGTSFALTTAIIHIVCDRVVRWPFGALTNVDHTLKGAAADTELLRLAVGDKLAIVTNEELTERGVIPNPRKLRSRAQAASVSVFTPKEYLEANGVDVRTESAKFVAQLRDAVAEAKKQDALDGHEVVGELVPLYRMILLDDIDDRVAHIVPPPMP